MRNNSLFVLAAMVVGALALPSCTKNASQQIEGVQMSQPNWSKIPGALVQVSTRGRVGVLLDEIPEKDRERFMQTLLAEPQSFWIDRAMRQIRLTSLRLNFRNTADKKQLPLPPENLWKIKLQNDPQRVTIDGHDIVTVWYDISAVLLTDAASPGESEPALKEVGGTWDEQFVLPFDPEFIFQRTGFACMNESEFPPNSMDSEESDLFYDDRCTVEKKLSNTGCHQTEMPKMSCIQAVEKKIGKVDTVMHFEHLPWDPNLADQVRTGKVTNPDGSDLQPYKEEFLQHRFTYRYIPENSCTLEEKCVGGSGWRKLLMFPTADLNVGSKPLEIGDVDYFLKKNGSVLSKHGVFEFSPCHQHYHFSHYGTFSLGGSLSTLTRKNGFCMQPTARLMNNELSPLHHQYVDCIDQGVSVGWIDEYKMGLDCQWLDVTGVQSNQDVTLSFTTNPDGLLCEGKLRLDDRGNQLFEPTSFKTSDGASVDKPQCDVYPAWADNNTESYDVRLPERGDSYVTDACREGLFGPLRNCGFQQKLGTYSCMSGSKVTVTCSMPAGHSAQVVRVCETSRALQIGLPCTYNEALASATVDAPTDVSFTCPAARDSVETGGSYSFLTGSLFPGEKVAEVHCEEKL